jgi:hypothetical protein
MEMSTDALLIKARPDVSRHYCFRSLKYPFSRDRYCWFVQSRRLVRHDGPLIHFDLTLIGRLGHKLWNAQLNVIITGQHTNLGCTIDSSIVQRLKKLHVDIKVYIEMRISAKNLYNSGQL